MSAVLLGLMVNYIGVNQEKKPPHDLAGLVCNVIEDPDCINPCLGSTSGATWQHYQNELERYKDDE